jgi:hypothetical protein
MTPYLAALLFAVAPADVDAAYADLAKLPPPERPYVAYLALSDVPEAEQEGLAAVAKVVACSLSAKSHLPSQLPQRVEGTSLLRLDLAALGWNHTYGTGIIQHYPYARHNTRANKWPLVVSALWFVAQVTDPVETPEFQYQLLYGPKPPKTLAEFQAFWKIDKASFPWGFLEGNSGVSVNRKRSFTSNPTATRGGSAFGTFDFRDLDKGSDPLENLKPGSHRFDASEWIVGNPKVAGRQFGTLLVWWLNDAKGNRQDKAPADIVRDNTELRGVEIRNYVSCIACHPSGFVEPTIDEYDRYFRSGARADVFDKQTLLDIEAFYEADIAGDLEASRELYRNGIKMTAGLEPEEFATLFTAQIKRYDADLNLEQAAREVGCKADELKLALGYQSATGENVGARLAQLASDVPIPRDRWEENGHEWATYYLDTWRKTRREEP